MGLEFSRLNIFRPDPSSLVNVDDQIVEFIKMLDGKIKTNWQVLAPSASTRILYFEMENEQKVKLTSDSQLSLRAELGETKNKKGKKI